MCPEQTEALHLRAGPVTDQNVWKGLLIYHDRHQCSRQEKEDKMWKE